MPAINSACLIDSVFANNGNPAGKGKSGYLFAGASANGGTSYYVEGSPITVGQDRHQGLLLVRKRGGLHSSIPLAR